MGIEVTHGMTRRRALLAAAAVTAAALAGPGAAVGAPAAAGGLDPRRAEAYRRLLRRLREAPDGRFAHRPVEAACGAFAAWYAAQDAGIRVHADAVLDAIEAGGVPGPDGLRRAVPPPEAALLAAGIALAAVGCDPEPAEDERPDVPALGVPA
jgi:hypothetical protein